MKLIKILKNQQGTPDLSKYTVCNCVLSCIPLRRVIKKPGLDQTVVCTCNITVLEDGNLWLHGCSLRKPEGSSIIWTCEIQHRISLEKKKRTKKLTFYSRQKAKVWLQGSPCADKACRRSGMVFYWFIIIIIIFIWNTYRL